MSTMAPLWRRFPLGILLSARHGFRRLTTLRKLAIAAVALTLLLGVETTMLIASAHRSAPLDVYVIYCGFMILNFVLPFLSLITALGMLGGEIESGMLAYLLTRPCPRLAILLGRLIATAGATAGVVACLVVAGLGVAEAATRGSLGVGASLPLDLVAVGALGSLAFSALYLALVLCCRKPIVALAFGAAHAIVWEGIVAALPGRIGAYTLTQNLRALFFDDPQIGSWARRFLFRDAQAVPPADDALVFLTGVTLAAIALAWYRFAGRES